MEELYEGSKEPKLSFANEGSLTARKYSTQRVWKVNKQLTKVRKVTISVETCMASSDMGRRHKTVTNSSVSSVDFLELKRTPASA